VISIDDGQDDVRQSGLDAGEPWRVLSAATVDDGGVRVVEDVLN
jgi:hypothetical protein